MKIYLASGSPRRRELLLQIGLEFEVRVSEADETCDIKEPAALVEELSRRKALAVFRELENEGKSDFCVIGADTVVALEGEILGKPRDKDDAVRMLERLSGKRHEVFTGGSSVCAGGKNGAGSKANLKNEKTVREEAFYEKTSVCFYPMSDEETEEYVSTGDPLDKAGAYGIQGFCARYISGIEGDYNNVVGLPVGRLYQKLKNAGVMNSGGDVI